MKSSGSMGRPTRWRTASYWFLRTARRRVSFCRRPSARTWRSATIRALPLSGWITSGRTQVFAQRGITRFLINGTADQSVGTLSGGNQQKVVIAKSILREPKVAILDEPTRGIDVGARAAIYEIVAELARGGMAVIVVSSDLDEVLGLSHSVMVLSRGANRGILEREKKAGRVAVMELATS